MIWIYITVLTYYKQKNVIYNNFFKHYDKFNKGMISVRVDYIDIVNSDEIYVGGTFNILKMIYKLYCTFKIIIHQFILQLLNADKNL